MAVASIKFAQTGLPAVAAGLARRDIAKSVPVTMRNGDDTGVTSWRWTLLYKPPGSTAVIVNPNSAVATLTPDVDGHSYRIQLSINGGKPALGEVQTRIFRVPDHAGLAAPAAGEQGAEANYVVDAVANMWGWSDEYNRRFLHAVDTRSSPVVVEILSGADHVIEIPWTLHDAVLQVLEIDGGACTDCTVTFAVDVAFASKILLLASIDPSSLYKRYDHTTLSWPSTGLDGTIYMKITNNDPDATFRIGYRLGAL